MREIDIHDVAQQMLADRGIQAIADAAQKATHCEQNGEAEQARTWRHIEDAMKMMRGPHQS
jgi:hypothetical protein